MFGVIFESLSLGPEKSLLSHRKCHFWVRDLWPSGVSQCKAREGTGYSPHSPSLDLQSPRIATEPRNPKSAFKEVSIEH